MDYFGGESSKYQSSRLLNKWMQKKVLHGYLSGLWCPSGQPPSLPCEEAEIHPKETRGDRRMLKNFTNQLQQVTPLQNNKNKPAPGPLFLYSAPQWPLVTPRHGAQAWRSQIPRPFHSTWRNWPPPLDKGIRRNVGQARPAMPRQWDVGC